MLEIVTYCELAGRSAAPAFGLMRGTWEVVELAVIAGLLGVRGAGRNKVSWNWRVPDQAAWRCRCSHLSCFARVTNKLLVDIFHLYLFGLYC